MNSHNLSRAYRIKALKNIKRKCLACDTEFMADKWTHICSECKPLESRDNFHAGTRIGRIAHENHKRLRKTL